MANDASTEEYVDMPEWVREWKQSSDAKALRESANAEAIRAASLLMKYEGPKFAAEFLRELAFAFEASKILGFSGSVVPKSAPDSDHICRIEVILSGDFPKLTTTNVFYREGDSKIRLHTLENKAFALLFFVHHDGLRVRRENSIVPMDARDAANWLIKGMCQRASAL